MLLISDANILIDMDVGDLLGPVFRLRESFAVPNILYSEELEQHHSDLPALGLQIIALSEEGVASVMQLTAVYADTSTNDLFALVLAKEQQCPLLTGDKALRRAAEQEGVSLRGTLWLIEELVVQRVITLERARQAYDAMRNGGRRLPWEEVARQLKRLEKGYG